MENKKIIVSIIMPTFDSEKTIRKSLESIKWQNFDRSLIEILAIDGGSSDMTLEIAREFDCIILKNEKKLPEFAKHIGLLHANGRYAVFLDSDEVFDSEDAIMNRVAIFRESGAKMIFTGGYIKPAGAHFINDYINLFSDPFSFFIYGISSDARYYLESMLKKYKNNSVRKKYAKITLGENDPLPLSDLCAGNAIDVEYVRGLVGEKMDDANIIAQIIPIILKKEKCFFMLKNDFIIHFSSDSFRKYLNKLRWRIINNLFYENETAGFANRESQGGNRFKLKKYFFIPYSLTIATPLIQGLYYALDRKKTACLLHPVLAFYAGCLICYYGLLKIIGIKPKLMIYGK